MVVLAVLPGRKKKTVRQFLETIPERLRRTMKTVCTDMWDGYVNAVEEFAKAHQVSVEAVIDRFHVAKNYCAVATLFQRLYLDLEGYRRFA
ncbi:MAG: transposase [Chloroflexota bacterium]|nr:transposase [Chloroflexota bacterium]